MLKFYTWPTDKYIINKEKCMRKQFKPKQGIYYTRLKELQATVIKDALQATGNNEVKASNLLGINRNTFRKLRKQLVSEGSIVNVNQ